VLHPRTKTLVHTASPFEGMFRLELRVNSPLNGLAKLTPSALWLTTTMSRGAGQQVGQVMDGMEIAPRVMNGHLGPRALARYAAEVDKKHARCSRRAFTMLT
jgi:hypothetical protein